VRSSQTLSAPSSLLFAGQLVTWDVRRMCKSPPRNQELTWNIHENLWINRSAGKYNSFVFEAIAFEIDITLPTASPKQV
jgi:hypothetical protein